MTETVTAAQLAKLTNRRRGRRGSSGTTPAARLRKSVVDVLASHGWLVWRNGASAGRTEDGRWFRTGTVGLPDLMALRRGRLLCVELKASGDRMSPAQLDMQHRLREAGAAYIIATRVEDVFAWMLAEHETVF